MRLSTLLIASLACFMLPSLAAAQRIPFFDAAGTGFDPEISVVNSGELLDAQAVVSDDLKYVTINARPSSSRLLALREFAFANRDGRNAVPRFGFVGGAGARAVGRRAGDNDRNGLNRAGMTLVGRLDVTP